MPFQPGNKYTRKGVPNKRSKFVMRQYAHDLQAAFAKIGNASPQEFRKMVKNPDGSETMLEKAAVVLMNSAITKGDPVASKAFAQILTSGLKPEHFVADKSVELKETIAEIRAAVDTGFLTLEAIDRWYARAAEKFAGDPISMRHIDRVSNQFSTRVKAAAELEVSRQNSIPIATLNLLLQRNAAIAQRILAGHPELLERYAADWSADVLALLPNAAPEHGALIAPVVAELGKKKSSRPLKKSSRPLKKRYTK